MSDTGKFLAGLFFYSCIGQVLVRYWSGIGNYPEVSLMPVFKKSNIELKVVPGSDADQKESKSRIIPEYYYYPLILLTLVRNKNVPYYPKFNH